MRQAAGCEGRVKTTARSGSQQMPLACTGRHACCSQQETLPRKKVICGCKQELFFSYCGILSIWTDL